MSEGAKITYGGEEIMRIDPIEHVRKRPGMYIGGRDQRALHHLIYEIVDHSIELSFAGLCDHTWITLRNKNEVYIRDNGPEISVDTDKVTGLPLLESFMTRVGVSNERVHGFPETRYTGLHSTGLWVVNALCAALSIESAYNGYLWKQEYNKGIPQTKVTQVRALEPNEPLGMAITFRPDFTIFEAVDFDYEVLVNRLRETAYLASRINISIFDERTSPKLKTEFRFPNGMADVVRDCNIGQVVLHEIIYYRGTYVMDRDNRQEEIEVELALQFTNSNETVIKSYVNTWRMDGGTQIQGLQSALVGVINAKATNQTDEPFTWEEIKMGLTVGLNVKMDNPSIASQIHIVLINPVAYTAVEEVVYRGVNDENLDTILEKCKANRVALKSKSP